MMGQMLMLLQLFLRFQKKGLTLLATRGLLVRHLVLPENLADGAKIIDFLAEQISTSMTINVMDQYRPCYKASSHSKINRRPTFEEIESARRYAIEKGLNVLL